MTYGQGVDGFKILVEGSTLRAGREITEPVSMVAQS